MLEAARVQAERMVQRTEVVRAAEQRARQVSRPPRPTRAASATRPRTSSTSGSAASRSCSTSCSKTVAAGRQRLSIGSAGRSRRSAIERRRPDQGLLRPGPLTSGWRWPTQHTMLASTPSSCCATRARAARRAPPSAPARSASTMHRVVGRHRRSRSTRSRRSTASSSTGPSPRRGAAQCRRCLDRVAGTLRVGRRRAVRRRHPERRGRVRDRRRPDRPGADGARGRPARPPRRAAVPGRLRRALPDLRHRPQRGAVRLRRARPIRGGRRWTSSSSTRLTLRPRVAARRRPRSGCADPPLTCRSPLCT